MMLYVLFLFSLSPKTECTQHQDIFSDAYIGSITQDILQLFFRPARYVGTIWTELPCPPSLAPTTSPTKTTQSPTKPPVESANLVSSQPPSQSSAASPTHQPSKEPSSSPTKEPSSSPTKAPSTSPTVLPTTSPSKQTTVTPTTKTYPPTKTVTPSVSASMPPSLSSMPTNLASAKPSTQPSTSQAPSFKPSFAPSLIPSMSPSNNPSIAPSPTYNCLIVDDITYDIWHPPMDQIIVEKDFIGNVTKSFRELFADPDSVLYPLVQSYDLGFCDGFESTVDRISTTSNNRKFISQAQLLILSLNQLKHCSNVCTSSHICL